MWVSKAYMQRIVMENERLRVERDNIRGVYERLRGEQGAVKEQKVMDDTTIGWMRHRINELEKQNAILMQKVAGIAMPVPEIVSLRPGAMAPDFETMPSFEDCGEDEAMRLGITHDSDGTLRYTK